MGLQSREALFTSRLFVEEATWGPSGPISRQARTTERIPGFYFCSIPDVLMVASASPSAAALDKALSHGHVLGWGLLIGGNKTSTQLADQNQAGM